MDSFFEILDSAAPLVFMALVVMDGVKLRRLERRVRELESRNKTETDSDFWKRYETTRPNVK